MAKPSPDILDPRVRPDPRSLPPDAVVHAHRGYYCVVIGSTPTPRECVALLDHHTAQLTQRERTLVHEEARAAEYVRGRG